MKNPAAVALGRLARGQWLAIKPKERNNENET
jgi:hypothetical protein